MIEVIFSTFITLIVVLILQAIIKNLASSQRLVEPTDEVAYAYVQLDRFFHQKGTKFYLDPKRSTSQKAVINAENDKEKTVYLLTKYHDMLRMSTIYSGHMPLLLRVEQAKFKISEDTLKVSVTEKDHRSSELYFHFDLPPKKDAKKDKDDEKTKKAKDQESKS